MKGPIVLVLLLVLVLEGLWVWRSGLDFEQTLKLDSKEHPSQPNHTVPYGTDSFSAHPWQ